MREVAFRFIPPLLVCYVLAAVVWLAIIGSAVGIPPPTYRAPAAERPASVKVPERAPELPPPRVRHRRTIEVGDGVVRCVAFSPDGLLLAAGGDRFAHVFGAKSGERAYRLEGHTDAVNHVAFSADGAVLASGGEDKTIRLWEVKSGKALKVLKGDAVGGNHVHLRDLPVRCVAFLPDGKTLVSCGANHYVTMWDTQTGVWDHKIWTNHAGKSYTDGCYHLALTRDGKHCAIAGGVHGELFTRQVSLFAVDRGLRPVWNQGHDGAVAATHVSFSPDGTKLLSCGHDNAVRVWDVKTGRLLRALAGPDGNKVIQAAHFTGDGDRVVAVTRAGVLRLWTAGDGALLASHKVSEQGVLGLAVSPDGQTLATCGEDRAIHLWDIGADNRDKPSRLRRSTRHEPTRETRR